MEVGLIGFLFYTDGGNLKIIFTRVLQAHRPPKLIWKPRPVAGWLLLVRTPVNCTTPMLFLRMEIPAQQFVRVAIPLPVL
jgi:hypothetical protein